MKKAILITASIAISTLAMAQKINIQNASNSLKDKDYRKAIEYINLATTDPSTKDNPKAWFLKGNIYMEMNGDPAKKDAKHYRDATTAYLKAAQLDAKYERDAVTQSLLFAAYTYYNDAALDYNKKNYEEAIRNAKAVIDIHALEGGKRFTSKSFDTVASASLMIQSYSSYYAEKYDEAIPLLQTMKNDPIEKNANVYLLLADIYKRTNKNADMLAIIEEGRVAYPDNQSLRNEELNYYILSGKQDILMKKLEDAVAKDPKNADLLINLANGYTSMAFPKSIDSKEPVKPDNYEELFSKSEDNYNKAIGLDPDNAGYNYNLGVLYYNHASGYNKQMNDAADAGNKTKVPAERKKHEDAYNKLMSQRDTYFDKAIPFFVKAVNTLEPKIDKVSEEDKFTYQGALSALKEIYARRNDMTKSNQYKEKLNEFKSR
ncbi:hypothetical protein CAP35_09500 [Chitinophagaceae bacterium IBVUCB1]|nr:hypothetical protein CAP35_09500 [Chitinophagaceae bacterium IBVUCB1]